MGLTIGSLFSGIGGLELGLEIAGLGPVIWQAETDDYCRRVLARHWPDVRRYEDVEEIQENAERPDIICGGFPCQDISYAGKGEGLEGAKSGLWREFARIIRELRPRFVVVENVPALLARGLGDVLGDLASCGYDAQWDCIPASSVGAPHQRDRLFIVAKANRAQCEGIGIAGRNGAVRTRPGGIGSQGNAGAFNPDSEPIRKQHGQVGWRENTPKLGNDGISRTVGHSDRQGQSAGPLDGEAPRMRWLEGDSPYWPTIPDLSRMDDGLPNRLDRVRSLGNAVVPAVAAIVGRIIVDLEAGGTPETG